MRHITYAGETVITTDDVAATLVELTAAIANEQRAEAVSIPIVLADTGNVGTADLVIGVGNDVLSAPVSWEGEEPDFSAYGTSLRDHPSFPHRRGDADAPVQAVEETDRPYDFDFEGIDRA